MCDEHNAAQVVVGDPLAEKVVDVDRCIAPLVAALNSGGFYTVASCCGHGHRPGVISLKDGRELVIAPDYDTARTIDGLFPLTCYGEPVEHRPGSVMEFVTEIADIHHALGEPSPELGRSAVGLLNDLAGRARLLIESGPADSTDVDA